MTRLTMHQCWQMANGEMTVEIHVAVLSRIQKYSVQEVFDLHLLDLCHLLSF